MRSLILTGDSNLKEEFISKYIKENKIPSYNIYVYDEPLKISDTRNIKKILGIKSGDKRLFVINSNPSIEAQNALLKTLEELPEDSDFIFSCDLELLPTIVSRSQIIKAGTKSLSANESYKNLIINLIKDLTGAESSCSIFAFSESINHDEIEEVLISLRVLLLEFIKDNKIKESIITHRMLKTLVFYYPLLSSNNLNKRIALERALLQEFHG